MTLKIGLTGGIGAGKTTVAKVFESFGVPVFYADNVAKKLISGTPSLKQKIISVFGKESFMGDHYNTRFISRRVFNDPELLSILNNLVHPYVHGAFIEWYSGHIEKPYVVEEAALLLQSGGAEFFDYIIVVSAPEPVRLHRVIKRDGLSPEEVAKRMKFQWKENEMIKLADFVLINDPGSLLIPRVLNLHNKFVSLHK